MKGWVQKEGGAGRGRAWDSIFLNGAVLGQAKLVRPALLPVLVGEGSAIGQMTVLLFFCFGFYHWPVGLELVGWFRVGLVGSVGPKK